MKKILFSLFIALVVGAIVIPNHIFADNNSVSFETYTLGSISGQDGWGNSVNPLYDQEVVANTFGYATFGTQSLRMSNSVTSGSFGDWVFSKSLANEAGETSATNAGFSGGIRQPHFEAQWDFASTVKTAEQPGLQISISPDRGDGSRASFIRLKDTPEGLAVDFSEVTGTTSPVTFNTTTIASGLSRSTTHTVRLTIDFIDGPSNDVVKVYVDGNLVKTGTSWENYYIYDNEASAEQHARTVDSLILQARTSGGEAPSTDGNGFLIDNITLLSGPIPTPTPTPTVITPTPIANLPLECTGMTFSKIINGTNKSETLNGTSGNDFIYGGNGSDYIDGKGGNDCIVTGNGSSIVLGGAGNDVIVGGNSSDSINGEGGMDKIYGNNGSDYLTGGADADEIWGGNGSDLLSGDGGADKLYGEGGSDVTNGGAGSDTCVAESKNSCEL